MAKKSYIEIKVDGKWLGHKDFERLGVRADELYIKTYPNDTIIHSINCALKGRVIKPGDSEWTLGEMLRAYPEHIRKVEEDE